MRKSRVSTRKKQPRVYTKKNQPYDTNLKQWVKKDPAHIIPVLLPGAEYLEPLDIEIIRPTLRADRVFKILYRGKPRILNIEFETGTDSDMRSRLLVYNSILYHEYKIPVMSLIIYPFRTTIAESPLHTGDDDDEITIFHFRTLPLFSLAAEQYVQEHITCMYPLLPSMQGMNASALESVVAELAALYREDEVTLSEQLVLMELLLARTTTISEEEKAKIEGSLKMYDPLWEEHPKVKRIKAQAKADAQAEIDAAKAEKARAEAEARIRAEEAIQAYNVLRESILELVKTRFPELKELAEQRLKGINSPDVLKFLLVQVASAANETVARNILHPSAA